MANSLRMAKFMDYVTKDQTPPPPVEPEPEIVKTATKCEHCGASEAVNGACRYCGTPVVVEVKSSVAKGFMAAAEAVRNGFKTANDVRKNG